MNIDARKARQLLAVMDAEIASWARPFVPPPPPPAPEPPPPAPEPPPPPPLPPAVAEERAKFAANTHEYAAIVTAIVAGWEANPDPQRLGVAWFKLLAPLRRASETTPFFPYHHRDAVEWSDYLAKSLLAEMRADVAWRIETCRKEGTWDG